MKREKKHVCHRERDGDKEMELEGKRETREIETGLLITFKNEISL